MLLSRQNRGMEITPEQFAKIGLRAVLHSPVWRLRSPIALSSGTTTLERMLRRLKGYRRILSGTMARVELAVNHAGLTTLSAITH